MRALGLSAATQLMFAGSSGTLSNIGLLLTQLRYTRIAEREADVHALRILKGAGISAKGFGDFFERIDGKEPAPKSGKSASRSCRADPHPSAHRGAHRHGARPARLSRDARALTDEDWPRCASACAADGRRHRQPAEASALRPATAPPPVTTAPGRQSRQDTGAGRDIAEATKALAQNPNDVAALQKRARAYGKENRQHELALG